MSDADFPNETLAVERSEQNRGPVLNTQASPIKQLHTAAEIIEFMQEEVADRILAFHLNLRSSQQVSLVVCSLRASGAASIDDYVRRSQAGQFRDASAGGPVIGLVASFRPDEKGEMTLTPDIKRLLNEAYEANPSRQLAQAGYDDLFVLSTHPDAD